jgi:hypothetical protein
MGLNEVAFNQNSLRILEIKILRMKKKTLLFMGGLMVQNHLPYLFKHYGIQSGYDYIGLRVLGLHNTIKKNNILQF